MREWDAGEEVGREGQAAVEQMREQGGGVALGSGWMWQWERRKRLRASRELDNDTEHLTFVLLHLCPLSLFPPLISSIHLSTRYNMDGAMKYKILHSDDWERYPSPSLRKKRSVTTVFPLYTSSQTIKELKYKHLQELKKV